MKFYDAKEIRTYIDAYKNAISVVEVGMREDWSATSETVFENGKCSEKLMKAEGVVRIRGIQGSFWATPVMNVYFNDGHREIVDAYFDDGQTASLEAMSRLSTMKALGGFDRLEAPEPSR